MNVPVGICLPLPHPLPHPLLPFPPFPPPLPLFPAVANAPHATVMENKHVTKYLLKYKYDLINDFHHKYLMQGQYDSSRGYSHLLTDCNPKCCHTDLALNTILKLNM